jgi:dTDP-4-dehydrorhamnose reductase
MLGTEVARRLASEYDVIAADVDDFDIRDADATSGFVDDAAPDVVVNCAAYTDVDGAESDAETAFAINERGAANVAAAAIGAGATVVHMSTDYVFDGGSETPYLEEDEPNPRTVYGRSKLSGELAVLEVAPRALVVRTAWLYGHAGANFVDKMLSLASAGVPLRVVDDQFGAPTNARDLAAVVAELVAAGASGVVNATNAGSCSWFELAREALSLAGLENAGLTPVSTEEFPRPAQRPTYSVLSLEKLKLLTGRTPRNWREALAEYVAER